METPQSIGFFIKNRSYKIMCTSRAERSQVCRPELNRVDYSWKLHDQTDLTTSDRLVIRFSFSEGRRVAIKLIIFRKTFSFVDTSDRIIYNAVYDTVASMTKKEDVNLIQLAHSVEPFHEATQQQKNNLVPDRSRVV